MFEAMTLGRNSASPKKKASQKVSSDTSSDSSSRKSRKQKGKKKVNFQHLPSFETHTYVARTTCAHPLG